MNRRKGNHKFAKLLIILFLCPVLLFGLIFFIFFRSGLFDVRQVDVKSDKLICTEVDQLKNYIALHKQNFFLIDSEKIAKILKEKFICIKDVILSRSFPNKIRLEIVPRQPVAVLITLRDRPSSSSALIEDIATPSASALVDFYIVDDEGMVFSKDINGLNVPIIYTYNSKISLGKKLEDLVDNAVKILDKIRTFGITIRKSWIIDSFYLVRADTEELSPQSKIIFQLDKKIDIQLASLQLILDKAKIDLKELEFIDLRFDKPVVRFAPQERNGER